MFSEDNCSDRIMNLNTGPHHDNHKIVVIAFQHLIFPFAEYEDGYHRNIDIFFCLDNSFCGDFLPTIMYL